MVRHSNIFCRTFIRNVRLSDRSDEFRHHCKGRHFDTKWLEVFSVVKLSVFVLLWRGREKFWSDSLDVWGLSKERHRDIRRWGVSSVVTFAVLCFCRGREEFWRGGLDVGRLLGTPLWYQTFDSYFCFGFAEEGKSFGEIALMSEESVRNATVISDDETDLLVISRELFNRSMKVRSDCLIVAP